MAAEALSISEGEILAEIADALELVLGLDFDGTLAPIVDDPKAARAPDSVRKTLLELSRRPEILVAIVTGRSIEDLDGVFDARDLWVLGRHGMQWAGPGARPRMAPGLDADKVRTAISALKAELRPQVSVHQGAWLEDKAVALAMHTRGVAEDVEEVLARVFRQAVPDTFDVIAGKKVFEARPRGHDKGQALTELIRTRMPRALPIYIGDDTTDEDAFRALGERAITIRVLDDPDQRDQTAARYWVSQPEEVHAFIELIAGVRRGG